MSVIDSRQYQFPSWPTNDIITDSIPYHPHPVKLTRAFMDFNFPAQLNSELSSPTITPHSADVGERRKVADTYEDT